MIKKIENFTLKKMVAFSMAVIIILFLTINFGIFLIEAYQSATHQLQKIVLSPEDFEFYAIEEVDGNYVSIIDDSQLLLNKEMVISNVTLDISYQIDPGEVTLYYANTGEGAYSNSKRIWFNLQEDGLYTAEFYLAKRVDSIRIDPTIYGGNVMQINSITFNEPKSFISYFSITPVRIYFFLICTLLLTAFFSFIKEIALFVKSDKKI